LNFSHFGLFKVVAAKKEIFPWCWGINHRQRPLQLQIHIVDLVKLTNKCLYEAFIESYVTYVIFEFSFGSAGSIPLH